MVVELAEAYLSSIRVRRKNINATMVNTTANSKVIKPKPCVPAPKHIGTKNTRIHPPTPILVLLGVDLSPEKTVNTVDNIINMNPMNIMIKPSITSLNELSLL